MDKNTDTRRYRSKASGRVYEVVSQSRSLNGSVTLRDPTDGVEIRTTNDRLAVDYEFFRVGESGDTRLPYADALEAWLKARSSTGETG